jgi:cytochrome c oxidase subunit 3
MTAPVHGSPAHGGSPFADQAAQERASRFGMWVFLATEMVFFGPLFVAYAYGRLHWGHEFAIASRHTDVVLGSLNTAVLLTSSALVALAASTAKMDAWRLTRRLLWATAGLGVIFLCIKGYEYHAEWQEGLFPGKHFRLEGEAAGGGELFFVLYFIMTGLHAIHMSVGIGLLSFFASRGREVGAHRIEIAALYWHFVDVMWIFLYPILYLVERHA